MLWAGLLLVNILDDGGERMDWMCVLGMGLEGEEWVE